jgi:1,4-alpha-glucan branching enzyme
VDRHIGTLWATLYFSSVYSSAVRALLPNRRLIHWLQSPGYTNPLYRGIWPDIRAAIHGWACRRADVLVACSKAVAADYEGCFNLPPIRVIYGGVNDEALPSPISVTDRSETRRRYGVSDDAKLITIAARYSIDKGHSTLLGALQLLKDRHGIRPMCIAAGQGVLLDSLRTETAERGLDAQVRFVGSLPQPELFRLMQSSDVVAMPSLQEALGLAAMEAMALGTPLVVSDYYGLAELAAGGAAFRADVGSAASLAEALRQALGDSEERIRVCEAARRRIQESFVVSKISMQWKSTLTNAS